jgi:hypothetical protein
MEHGVISVALEMLARQILLMRAMRASSRPGNAEVDWDAGLCQFEFIGTLNQACERLVIRHFKGANPGLSSLFVNKLSLKECRERNKRTL